MGVQGPHAALELDRRQRRVEAPLVRGDLLRVGRPRVVLLGELEPDPRSAGRAPGRSARRRAARAAPTGSRSRRRARSARARRARPGPSRGRRSRRITHTPVSASPAMIARSIGAAPRQRGSSDGWTLSSSSSESSGSRISWPKAQTTPSSGSAARIAAIASAPSVASVLQQPDARARAAAAAAGTGATRRPRPCRRSGGVTTSSGRCARLGKPAQDRGGERRGAEVDDPQSLGLGLGLVLGLGLGRRAVGRALAQGAHRGLALPALGPVEDQHAVEVVDLVLQHARLEPGRLEQQRLAAARRARARGRAGAARRRRRSRAGSDSPPRRSRGPPRATRAAGLRPRSRGRPARPGRRAAGAGRRAGWRPGRRPSRRA